MAAHEPLIYPLPAATLVFGLEWLPLLGGRAERIGLRLARQHRATHMVLAGESAGSVGLAGLRHGRAQQKACLYSAAQNMAQLFSTGTVALLLDMAEAGYWLVAVHEGAVVARTDRLHRSSAEARLVIAELRQAYPQLVLLGDPNAPEPPGLAAIEAASSPHSRLHVLSRWKPMLPRPVQGFALALVLVLLLPRLWPMLRPHAQAPVRKPSVSPRQAWQSAVEQSARRRFVHGVQGTRVLLDALYGLPVRVGGWALQQAECGAQARQWRCQARYERRSAQASNRQFLAGSPAAWTVEFVSMDQAQPVWSMPAHGTSLLAEKLDTSSHNERDLFSALQAIRPAFSQMQIGRPAPLPVSAPSDEQGRPLPRPPEVALYLSRPVQLSGPLRSGSLLLPHAASVEWNKAVLTLHNVEQPGLKSSSLSLSLQGVLYETEIHPDPQDTVHGAPGAAAGGAPPLS